MPNKVTAVALLEFNRIKRSWIFWLGVLLLDFVQLFLDSPIKDGHLWVASSAAYSFGQGVCMLGSFFIPFLMAFLYYYDHRSELLQVVFSQPIRYSSYALGKFLGGFMAYITIVLIGIVINLFVPLYFKAVPYSPLIFLKVLGIYIIPSMFFYAALSYLIVILLKEPVLTIILPIFYLLFLDAVNPKYHYLIRGKELATLAYGQDLPPTLVTFLIQNRLLTLSAGLILLISAVLAYSPKKYIEGR